MRLLLALSHVGARRRDEEDVGHIRFLGSSDQLGGDVVLVFMGRRDNADGVAARIRERLNHLANTSGLVCDDLCAYIVVQWSKMQCMRYSLPSLPSSFTRAVVG